MTLTNRSPHTPDCPRLDFSARGSEHPVVVNTATKENLLHDLKFRLHERSGFTVATLNLDHVVKIRRDSDFHRAYVQHTHVVADGNPIVWMSRLSGDAIDLVPGSELVEPVADLAADLKVPIGLFGATQTVLDQAAEHLISQTPHLEVVSKIAPPAGFDPQSAAAVAYMEEMSRSPARVWFLALGAPKQEVLAARAAIALPDRGFISVGAGLDFLAGTQKRAPSWVRKFQLEWFWRVARSPMRLGARYMRCIAILPDLTLSALWHRMHRNQIGAHL